MLTSDLSRERQSADNRDGAPDAERPQENREDNSEQDWITIARIVRPRGNKGEVAAQDALGDADRFTSIPLLRLVDAAGRARTAELERAWEHRGALILKFAGSDSISDAELLRHCELQSTREALGPPPEGEFYYRDLEECRVVDAETGEQIGIVEEVLENTEQLLLSVRRENGKEVLIPFVRELCASIDVENGEIRVDAPDGLVELNG